MDRPYFQLATLFAHSGRADRARAVLRVREQEFKDTARLRGQRPGLHAVLGEIALAEGRGRDAVAEFWKSDSAADGPSTSCLRCVYASVARGYDAAGVADSAIAYLELYLKTPDLGAALSMFSPDPQYLGPALERLGQLYEAKGNTEKAAEYFGKFVSLWEHADPVAQPRVAEARRRMQKLRPVEKAKP